VLQAGPPSARSRKAGGRQTGRQAGFLLVLLELHFTSIIQVVYRSSGLPKVSTLLAKKVGNGGGIINMCSSSSSSSRRRSRRDQSGSPPHGGQLFRLLCVSSQQRRSWQLGGRLRYWLLRFVLLFWGRRDGGRKIRAGKLDVMQYDVM